MSDTSLRLAERALTADPSSRTARALSLLAVRSLGEQGAAAYLLELEERLFAEGKALGRASTAEMFSGATDRPAKRALDLNWRAVLAIADVRVALDNDMVMRPTRAEPLPDRAAYAGRGAGVGPRQGVGSQVGPQDRGESMSADPDYDTRRPRAGMTVAQADGTACVLCGAESLAMVPAGWVTDNPLCESQTFRCAEDCTKSKPVMCEADGPAAAGRHGCPGGRPAAWAVATTPCCSACLARVVGAAMRKIQDDTVRVSRVVHPVA